MGKKSIRNIAIIGIIIVIIAVLALFVFSQSSKGYDPYNYSPNSGNIIPSVPINETINLSIPILTSDNSTCSTLQSSISGHPGTTNISSTPRHFIL